MRPPLAALRDIHERGRDIGYVLRQYTRHVKPAFDEFIFPVRARRRRTRWLLLFFRADRSRRPASAGHVASIQSKQYADIIIPRGRDNQGQRLGDACATPRPLADRQHTEA